MTSPALALRSVDALVDTPDGRVLHRDTTVVVEGDRVTAVGPGAAPTTAAVLDLPGRLVLPGLVNLHVHAGSGAHHHLVAGAGERDLLGATYLTTKATRAPLPAADPIAEAEWTVWELLRGGTTTALEAGAPPALARAFADVATRIGLRAHVGAALSSGRWSVGPDGGIGWRDDPASDVARIERADAFLRRLRGSELVRGAVAVTQADAASDGLLVAAVELAAHHGVPFTVHAAQNRREVLGTVARHGTTPLTRLDRLGVLRPGTVLAHAVFLDHHPAVASGAVELDLLAASGAAVAHCPVHLARRGEALQSFATYRSAGVPVGIGTDTHPRDLLAELRAAALLGRAVAGPSGPGAGEVVDAATTVGADALGRPELGRLRVGGPADLVVVDLRGVGVVRDPVQAAIDGATGADVEHVLVAGRQVVRSGEVVGLDGARLRRTAQAAAEELWRTAGEWHRHGRDAVELSPHPFPHVVAADAAAPRLQEVAR